MENPIKNLEEEIEKIKEYKKENNLMKSEKETLLLKKIEKKIEETKKELVEKADEKGGLWENFGRKKQRKLEEKEIPKIINKTNFKPSFKFSNEKLRKLLDDFEKWKNTCDLTQLKIEKKKYNID
ncbi:MAG: hypothetical protein ACOCP8_04860 [archaeon]